MRSVLILPLAALSLAACQQKQSTEESAKATGEVSLTNASVEEVAKQANAAGQQVKFKPGAWETTVNVTDIDLPGAPPEMAKMMIERLKGKPIVSSNCMTQEEADKPNSSLFTGEKNPNCRFEKYEMAGGKIDLVMNCAAKEGTSRMTMQGSFAPESMTMNSEIEATGPDGKRTMHQKATVTGKRTGECTAATGAAKK